VKRYAPAMCLAAKSVRRRSAKARRCSTGRLGSKADGRGRSLGRRGASAERLFATDHSAISVEQRAVEGQIGPHDTPKSRDRGPHQYQVDTRPDRSLLGSTHPCPIGAGAVARGCPAAPGVADHRQGRRAHPLRRLPVPAAARRDRFSRNRHGSALRNEEGLAAGCCRACEAISTSGLC